MIAEGEGFDCMEWTSLREYRKPPSKRFGWMETAKGFEVAGQGNGPADCGRRPGDEAAEEDAYCKNYHLTPLSRSFVPFLSPDPFVPFFVPLHTKMSIHFCWIC